MRQITLEMQGCWPEECAEMARGFEAKGQWAKAEAWYRKASMVTFGHNRSARYLASAEECKAKAGRVKHYTMAQGK